jgi:small conductance mechanosensitive channel
MWNRLFSLMLVAGLFCSAAGAAGAATRTSRKSAAVPKTAPKAAVAPHTAPKPPLVTGELAALLADILEAASARDSLLTLSEGASGSAAELLEEMSWQQQLKVHRAVISLADRVSRQGSRGQDLTGLRKELGRLVKEAWPRYLGRLQRRQQNLYQLGDSSESVSGAKRLAIETELTRQADRLVEAYRTLVDVLLALKQIGLDVSDQREYIARSVQGMGTTMVTRVRMLNRDQAAAGVRLSRDASSAESRYEFESYKERFARARQSLSVAIELMDRLGLDATEFRVEMITATGVINTDVFRWQVLLGLLRAWWSHLIGLLAGNAIGWLFKAIVVILTFFGFRELSHLVRRGVRRAVSRAELSALMRSTMARLSGYGVMLLGLFVVLTQLGVQVAPLLAGLGIAGFVVGFAMQSTLSNFAAGGMILANQPFDVGDEIEVVGVLGVVQKMGLVSTTILTPDNQKVIIPNSTLMNGVIRNRTAEPTRRVDLVIKVSYSDDFEKAEHILRELVDEHRDVLKEPPPFVGLQNLADSSLDIVVRVWAPTPRYWDVYRDLTRAAKLRLDREGLTFPFPQQEVHVRMDKGAPPPGA